MTVQTASIVPLRHAGHRPEGVARTGLVLRIVRGESDTPRVVVIRAATGGRVASWVGEIARQLVAAPAIRRLVDGDGDYPCSQACVSRILLAAAAIEAGLEAMRRRRDAALADIAP